MSGGGDTTAPSGAAASGGAGGVGAVVAGEPSFAVGTSPIHRVALLTNPAAGKGGAADAAAEATERLIARGVDVVHLQGATVEASEKLARAAIEDDRADALVVCGGDGLIGLALQAQAQSGKPLGIIPAGTGNDHAREYGIPLQPTKAADVIADGFWTTADLGIMRDGAGTRQAWFGSICCMGFDSLVNDRTNQLKWPKGRNRYNLAIALEFANLKSIETRLTLEPGTAQEQVIEGKSLLIAAANTRSYGGGMIIAPEADHHDGLLTVTRLGDIGRLKVAQKFTKIFTGTLGGEEGVEFHRARKIRVEMQPVGGRVVSAYADGDRFCDLPVEVEIVQGAGKFLVPRP